MGGTQRAGAHATSGIPDGFGTRHGLNLYLRGEARLDANRENANAQRNGGRRCKGDCRDFLAKEEEEEEEGAPPSPIKEGSSTKRGV